MNIKNPEFDIYQRVILYWEEKETKTQVVRRWLDLDDDDGYWWYELQGKKNSNNRLGLFPESAITKCSNPS